MSTTATLEVVWKTGKGKLLVIWFGLDAALYLGALLTLAMTLTDLSLRPLTYAFTIALVTSWALRMAYGIWLEQRRVHHEEEAKFKKLNEILKKHGLTEDQSASLAREIKGLG